MDENTRNYASREELLAEITKLESSVDSLESSVDSYATLLEVANQGLESWRRKFAEFEKAVEALCLEHADQEGTVFFDEIVELFDIELTRTVTVQYRVSVEVQATVPASMSDKEVEEELTFAHVSYEFHGNGDIVIEGTDVGLLEVE